MHNGTDSPAKRVRTTISIDLEVWEKGKAMAADDRRDFSAQIEVLILQEEQRRKLAGAELGGNAA